MTTNQVTMCEAAAACASNSQLQRDLAIQLDLVKELQDCINLSLTNRLKPLLISPSNTTGPNASMRVEGNKMEAVPVRSELGRVVAEHNTGLRSAISQLKRMMTELDI